MKKVVTTILFLICMTKNAQSSQSLVMLDTPRVVNLWDKAPQYSSKRYWTMMGTGISIYSGAMVGLYKFWYKEQGLNGFRFFNDGREWRGVDKFGHFTTAYNYTGIGFRTFEWCGLSERSSLIQSVIAANFLQLSLEVFDGFSPKWGFSLFDIAANTSGTMLFFFQQKYWKEQRIIVKTSSHQTPFNNYYFINENTGKIEGDLISRDIDLYGQNNVAERFLKDYNAQVNWLSFNIKSFLPKSEKFPSCLNVAVGYGAGNIWGGFANQWQKNNYTFSLNKDLYPRYSRYLISFDLDLSKIKVKSAFLRTVLKSINFIKIPAPSLQITSRGKINGYWIYY